MSEVECHADVVVAFVTDFDDVGLAAPFAEAELFIEFNGAVVVTADAEGEGLKLCVACAVDECGDDQAAESQPACGGMRRHLLDVGGVRVNDLGSASPEAGGLEAVVDDPEDEGGVAGGRR